MGKQPPKKKTAKATPTTKPKAKAAPIYKPKWVSRLRFMEMCGGMNKQTLGMAVTRGNVVENSKHQIDVNHPKTIKYQAARLRAMDSERIQSQKDFQEETQNIKLATQREDLRIKELTRKKLEAENMPTTLIYPIVNTFFKEAFQQTFFGFEGWFRIVTKKEKLKVKDASKYKADMVKAINVAIDKAKAGCLQKVDGIIKEYKDGTG